MNINFFFVKNQNGQTIISALISIAILGVIVAAMTTMFQYQNREVKSLNEKLSSLSLERALIATLANGSVCSFELTNAGPWLTSNVPVTFDASILTSASPPIISLNKILTNASPDAPAVAEVNTLASLNSNSAFIKSIQIMDITGAPSGNVFKAFIQVAFDSDKMTRSIQPISIQQTILTSGTGNIKTITGCAEESAGGNWQCNTRVNGGSGAVGCVRASDGTVCGANAYGPGNWNCYTPGSWPGNGNWQCSSHVNAGPGAVGCVRASDGTVCGANAYGPGNWNCYTPGSWPN